MTKPTKRTIKKIDAITDRLERWAKHPLTPTFVRADVRKIVGELSNLQARLWAARED